MEHRGRMGPQNGGHDLAKRRSTNLHMDNSFKSQTTSISLRSLHKPREGLLSLPCPFLVRGASGA